MVLETEVQWSGTKTFQELQVFILIPLPEQIQDQMTGNGNRSLPYRDEPLGPPLPEDMNSLNKKVEL